MAIYFRSIHSFGTLLSGGITKMNELTLTNLPGHLRIMDDLGIKPNYSQLARLYGIDRHTGAKIHKDKGRCRRKGRQKDREGKEDCTVLIGIPLPRFTRTRVYALAKEDQRTVNGTNMKKKFLKK